MGAEQSTPLSVEVKLEVDNGTITLKEVNTSEGKACEEHCKCDGRKRRARARKSKRGQTLNGQSNRDVQHTSNGRISGDSQGANRMGRRGRRKTDTSVESEIEVIALDDSSDGETLEDLEEEAELKRFIQRGIGRK